MIIPGLDRQLHLSVDHLDQELHHLEKWSASERESTEMEATTKQVHDKKWVHD